MVFCFYKNSPTHSVTFVRLSAPNLYSSQPQHISIYKNTTHKGCDTRKVKLGREVKCAGIVNWLKHNLSLGLFHKSAGRFFFIKKKQALFVRRPLSASLRRTWLRSPKHVTIYKKTTHKGWFCFGGVRGI